VAREAAAVRGSCREQRQTSWRRSSSHVIYWLPNTKPGVPMRRLAALLLLTLVARSASGQSEDLLRTAFEGKTVVVKIEMPGAAQGIDIHPGTARPIDLSQNSGRLKRYGIAYHPGDAAQVTKVHISGDHIEFQLGAGGFGTAGDDASTAVSAPVAPKTQHEKDLEASVKSATDPAQKKRMNDEIDRLRSDRQREDARNASRAAEAQAIKEATVMQKRMAGGSRFNLRYDHDVPAAAMTPDAVMAALADYLDFSGAPTATVASAPTNIAPATGGNLKKGMSVDEVDAIMGRPESITQRAEGRLTVSTSTYRSRDRKVTAEFVEGVLIRFTVASL
jgi:hypothetical protein